MIQNNYRLLIAMALSALPLCAIGGESCLDSLAQYRADKEAELLGPDGPPFSEEFRAEFTGFSYYEGDESFCVDATFEAIDDSRTVDYPTFDGRTIPFRSYGIFSFELGGKPWTLTAFQRMDLPEVRRQWVLIMFRDLTNGDGSYGGGRYVQMDLPIEPETVIDFNRADNPYCAYQAQFACPVPPVENWLKVAIPAGEKDYAGGH